MFVILTSLSRYKTVIMWIFS